MIQAVDGTQFQPLPMPNPLSRLVAYVSGHFGGPAEFLKRKMTAQWVAVVKDANYITWS